MTEAKSLFVVLSANASQYHAALAAAGRDTDRFGDKVDVMHGRLDDGGNVLDRYSSRLGLVVQGITVLTPAVSGLAAAAVPALTATANILGISAAAGLSATIALQGVGDALTALNEAKADPTEANIEKAVQQLEALSPAAAAFVIDANKLIPALKRVRDAGADELLPDLSVSMDLFERMLPRFERFVATYSDAVGDLAIRGAADLGSDRWAGFIDFLEGEAKPTLSSLASITGDVGHGLAELWMDFDPVNDNVLDSLVSGAEAFDRLATGADDSEGFQEFLSFINENGPKVGEAVVSIADAILQIGEAASPLTGEVLDGITLLFDTIAEIADSPAGPVIFGLAAGISAMSLASKAWQTIATSAYGSTLTRGVGNLRTLTTELLAVTSAQQRATMSAAELAAMEQKRAGVIRSSAATAGRQAALIGGMTLATTGLSDSMGATNTVMGAMVGSMAGPWGTAIGTAIGLGMDFAATNDEITKTLEDLNAATYISGGGFTGLTASLDAAKQELDQFKSDTAMDGEDWLQGALFSGTVVGLVANAGEIKNALEGVFGESDVDEATAEYERAETRLQATKDAAQGLAEVMGGPLSDAARQGALSTAELEQVLTRFQPAMDSLGITVEDLANALMIQNAAQEATISGAYWAVPPGAVSAYDDLVAGLNSYSASLDTPAERTKALADAIADLDSTTLSAADAADALDSALSAVLDPNMNLSEATDEWIRSLRTLNDDLAKHGRELRGNTNIALNNREAIRGRVTQIKDLLVAEAAAGASSSDLARSLRQQRQSLIAAGDAAGLSKDQLRKYLRQLGLTPKLVRTTLEAVGVDTASRAVRKLRGEYRGLPKVVRSYIQANGVPQTKAEVNALVKQYELTEKDRQALIRLKDAGAKKGISDINKLLKTADETDPNPTITANTTQADNALRATQNLLDGLHDKTIDIWVNRHGGGEKDANGGLHVGGTRVMADGGYGVNGQYYPRVSQIVRGGAHITWAEQETGWEAYISGKPSQRNRNRMILGEAARRLGMTPAGARVGVELAAGGGGRTVVVQQAALPDKVELVVGGRSFTAYVRGHADQAARSAVSSAEETRSSLERMNWP